MESLPGWNNDKVLNALPALQKSCRLVLKKLNRRNKSQEALKKYSGWQKSCDQITANNFNENTFREFLKRNSMRIKLDTLVVMRDYLQVTMSQQYMDR